MIGYDRSKRLLTRRDLSTHQPGRIPQTSQLISPITAHRHKYELKQGIPSKKSVESWFENHSIDERRVVYSFLESIHLSDQQNRKTSNRRKSIGANLDEVLQSIEKYRPQTSPNDEKTNDKSINSTETNWIDDKNRSRRYLSSTWRVTNPHPECEQPNRPEHNSSSFFNYTKKTVPEYYFIHPHWY